MKKIISAFLACAVMALSLAGCGEGGTPVPSSGNGPDGELPNTSGTATSVTWWMDPLNLSSSVLSGFDESLGWQKYEENLGVDIVWQQPPAAVRRTVNLIIARLTCRTSCITAG